jgi:hypothetical protein
MKIQLLLSVFLGVSAIALFPFSKTEASELKLDIYPILSATEGNCPTDLMINQESDPYREGGYSLRGTADLSNIAGDFVMVSQDLFSSTWTAVLNPEYANCSATGKITQIDGESYDYHSAVTVRLLAGQIIFKVDLTGISDANNYTASLLESGVENGHPFWRWGGSD